MQEGAPREIYMHPNTQFVAQFIGSTNQISGQVREQSGENRGTVKTEAGDLSSGLLAGLSEGSNVVVVIRPESIILHRRKPAQTGNVVEGKIATAMFLGEYVDCNVEVGRFMLQTHQPHSFEVRRGETIWVELPPGECLALPA